MSLVGKGLVLLALATVALMLVPTSTAAPRSVGAHASAPLAVTLPELPHGAAPVAPSPASAPAAMQARVLSELKAAHVPLKDAFLPNFNARVSTTGGVVSPLYNVAPAPMGLGYFGVQKSGGVNVGTISYSRSIEGAFTLNSVDPLYLASSSPDIFTVQLNSVLTHVTVAGNTSNQYWIQNVPIYYASTQTLSIEDNIWNFSSPAFLMSPSTLYSYGGTIVAPVFYYALGPTWHMPTPFTMRLYNNASVVNDRPTIYFNYSITNSTGSVISGSFDRVEFNSTGLAVPHHPAAPPTFQLNGKAVNPSGYLLNDAEIMLGGPGGGSTTSLFGINGSMALWTLPNGTSTYKGVPAAVSFGTDTGETSEGIAEWSTGGAHPMAMLGPGPSLLQPLWGLVGAQSGFVRETFNIAPSNAFVFASQGHSFNANSAAWAPVPPSGVAVYQLSPHPYTFRFLLSDYHPSTRTVIGTSSRTVTLASDPSLGVYTPLWAWNNAQLAGISQPGGAGTRTNPYVLFNNVVGPIDPLFGEFNDFFYFVFPGIFIANTNVHVSVSNAPSFQVSYSLTAESTAAAARGVPFSNNLEMQFYNASEIALVNTPVITGWVFSGNSFMSSVLFWNCNHDLIAGNTFQVQSTGLIVFGGTGTTIWGNVFSAATTSASTPGNILNGATENALQLFESGDLVYNNAFLTPVTAVTPPFNLYTGAPTSYVDRWNLPSQPATNVNHALGWSLSGSILGLSTQGGNFWNNYGSASNPYNVLPYNNGGAIGQRGDYAPQVPVALYQVAFNEVGLPSGTVWSVTLNGVTISTNGTVIKFWDPNGTYAYVVGPVTGFTAAPASGAAIVAGAHQHILVTWT